MGVMGTQEITSAWGGLTRLPKKSSSWQS